MHRKRKEMQNLEIESDPTEDTQQSLYSDDANNSDHHNDTPSITRSDSWDDNDLQPLVGGNFRPTFDDVSIQSNRKAWGPVVLFSLTLIGVLLAAILYIPSPESSQDRFTCPTQPAAPRYWEDFLSRVHANKQTDLCWHKKGCRCLDPTIPAVPNIPSWKEGWDKAVVRNSGLIGTNVASKTPLDAILLGDSITEHWLGTSMAVRKSKLEPISRVFESLFDKGHGAVVQGIALGVAGDRTPQVLSRLQGTERIADLDAKVVWLLIGTNDYNEDKCNIDSILAGQKAIIEEIHSQLPDATVVLNSVLPRDDLSFQKDFDALNRRLKCLADTTPKAKFFDATSLFLTSDQKHLNETMFYDKLHPSELGSRVFGQAMVDEILDIEIGG